MYNQIREDTLFLMFYASVAMLALIARHVASRSCNRMHDTRCATIDK